MVRITPLFFAGLMSLVLWGGLAEAAGTGVVSGELKKWHKVTITFDGPDTSETATPNPFTDYRLNVTFTKGGKSFVVPGYYAADGNAGETSAAAGNKWRVHFAPDEEGVWNYSASFRTGANIAVDAGATAGAATSFDGAAGSFSVGATDKSGRDLRAKGRLQYVGERYLKFAQTGEYFVKAGPDSPETMLGYVDFDGTYDHAGGTLKTWSPHVGDWQNGDVTWKGGKGKGLVGAINYLASEGCNVFSFLTYNAGGDGKDVWPFIAHDNKYRYDCSKLDQWSLVFDHATKKGFYLHFKTQETENDNESPWALDGGNVGVERKLYYRELIARFGHNLALNWNLGEENTQTTAQRQAMAQYFHDTDPYRHNVVLHTFPGQQNSVYTPLLGSGSKLTGVSIQINWDAVHSETLKWVNNSRDAGKNWVVANDEQGSAGIGIPEDGFTGTPTQKQCRGTVLWGNLLAGGAGIESYFGYSRPHSDLSCEDFRSRNLWWDSCRHALNYFNTIRFWEMQNANALVGGTGNAKYCFAKAGETYVVYLAAGGTTTLNLAGAPGTFQVKWYDPRNGGALQNGSVTSVNGGGTVNLGNPPSNPTEDWVIQVSVTGTPPQTYALTVNLGSGDGNYTQGTVVAITADAPPAGQVFDVWTGGVQFVANVNSASTTVTMPAANVAVTATYKTGTMTQSVTSLTLINADTDLAIGPLTNGATLNLATLPTRNLNVRANTNPATVGSVRFGLDGNANFATESAAPYALAGDSGGNFNPWTPSLGNHTLMATPYSAASGGGTAGTALTVSFTVIDDATGGIPAAPSALSATAASATQINLNWTDNASNETGFKIERKTGAGGVYAQIALVGANVASYQDTGLSAGTQYFYRVRSTNASGDSVFSNEASATTQLAPGQSVTALILVNADTDLDIGPLTNGMTLDLAGLPTQRLNVRAVTNPATVGSVRFAYDANSNFRTENVAVYAFAGNNGADYYAWTPANGNHTITATPYTGSAGTGTAGGALTVTFSVTGAAQVVALATSAGSSGDSDGDGLLDAYEIKVGLDPLNWDSDGNGVSDLEELDALTGLYGVDLQKQWLDAGGNNGGGGTPGTIGSIQILKFQARLKFTKTASDTLAFTGALPGLEPSSLQGGTRVNVSVNGETVGITLDSKLKGKADTTRSSAKVLKRVAGAGTTFGFKLNGGSWGSTLLGASVGLDVASVDVPLAITVNGAVYQVTVPTTYKGRAGVGGALKLRK